MQMKMNIINELSCDSHYPISHLGTSLTQVVRIINDSHSHYYNTACVHIQIINIQTIGPGYMDTFRDDLKAPLKIMGCMKTEF